MTVNLDMARKLIKAAIKEARAKNLRCSVAVADDRGVLKALYRMHHAPIPTADIARNKACTTATFRMPSSEIKQFGDPALPNCGFNTQNENDRLTTIGGGLPIICNDTLIGGIGISGGTPEEDIVIGQAALKIIST